MTPLRSIRLQNFQNHEDLKIDLSGRITTLSGPSGSGKSAVIRALRWVMRNEPRGDGFIRKGSKEAAVTLETGDGDIIIRRRGKGDNNSYELNGRVFKAFGTGGVPEEIEKILNISPLNLQGQHDPPFWFSETGGEISRQLNQIVDLGQIDSTLSSIDSIIKKTRIKIELIKERRSEAREKGKPLRFVRIAHEKLLELEGLNESLEDISGRSQVLEISLEKMGSIQKMIHDLEDQISAGEEVIRAGDHLIYSKERRKDLESILSKMKKYERFSDGSALSSLKEIRIMNESIISLKMKKERLQGIITNIEDGESLICQKEEDLKREGKRLSLCLGDQCPLCGSSMKK